MRSQLKKIFIGTVLLSSVLFLFAQESYAGFETFQLFDNSATGKALTLVVNGVTSRFSFNDDVFMAVETHPTRHAGPTATFGGTMTHLGSGQQISFVTELMNIRETAPGGFPQDVPYEQMFDDMENDPALSLTWDYFTLKMTPTTIISSTGGYQGPLTWIQKPNVDGNPSLFSWERFENDLFGISAWVRAVDKEGVVIPGTGGDFHFNADRQSNAVPEPATMALMAFGLSGMGMLRRKHV